LYPDLDPGGPKTYGSGGFGSGTLDVSMASITIFQAIAAEKRDDKKIFRDLEEGFEKARRLSSLINFPLLTLSVCQRSKVAFMRVICNLASPPPPIRFLPKVTSMTLKIVKADVTGS
jgi:hypothetical protein